jgi:hypothetical protein
MTIVVFYKTFEAVTWGNEYVLSSCFYVLSSGGMVSRTLDHVIYVGWKIYVTECKQELEVLWKSNVVLGLCGSEDFKRKKEGQWAQEKEKLEWFDPLETWSLSLIKKTMSYVVTG